MVSGQGKKGVNLPFFLCVRFSYFTVSFFQQRRKVCNDKRKQKLIRYLRSGITQLFLNWLDFNSTFTFLRGFS